MSYVGNNPKVKALRLDQSNISTTPPSGQVSIYTKSDNNVYTKNSLGNEIQLGAGGAGGKNYLATWFDFSSDPTTGMVTTLTTTGNRSSNTTVWGSSTTSLLTYETSSPLRAPGSAKFTLTTGQFSESPMFSLDAADLGKTLYLSFDYTNTGTFAAGDMTLAVIRYDSSGTYQETITPSLPNLPAGLSSIKMAFQTTSTAGDQYSIRFVGTNASSRVALIDSLIAGPQQQIAVGADGPWVATTGLSFAPGFGTITGGSYWMRRRGTNLEIRGRFAAGTVAGTTAFIQLPSGYTIDTTVLPNTPTESVGSFYVVQSATTNASPAFPLFFDGSTNNQIFFNNASSARGAGQYSKSGSSSFLSNSDAVDFFISVPIAGWGTGINLAPSAVPEYAYNSNVTTTVTDTTSFANGASGVSFASFDSNTIGGTPNLSTRRVRFSTSIQPTDRLILEMLENGSWKPARYKLINSNTAIYGMDIIGVTGSPTDVDVVFGRAGASASAVSSYGSANGDAWSNSSASKWRVAKYPAAGLSELAPATSTSAGFLDKASSGIYTPTLTGTVGVVTATTVRQFNYIQIGNIVIVSGQVTVTTSSAGFVTFNLSLPISMSTNFSTTFQASGNVSNNSNTVSSPVSGYVQSNSGAQTVFCQYKPLEAATFPAFIQFTYQIQ